MRDTTRRPVAEATSCRSFHRGSTCWGAGSHGHHGQPQPISVSVSWHYNVTSTARPMNVLGRGPRGCVRRCATHLPLAKYGHPSGVGGNARRCPSRRARTVSCFHHDSQIAANPFAVDACLCHSPPQCHPPPNSPANPVLHPGAWVQDRVRYDVARDLLWLIRASALFIQKAFRPERVKKGPAWQRPDAYPGGISVFRFARQREPLG